MEFSPSALLRWFFGGGPESGPGHLWPRWLFLRALGLIFFSAFYSLLFQIDGLIGPRGILPAGEYLHLIAQQLEILRYWYAPTLYWLGSGTTALKLTCWAGLLASGTLVFNLWPRLSVAVCEICYLSFVAAAQDFASYQSDGMLLAAGFLCLFFAPSGLRPRLGRSQPPSRASLFLLQWLWFRIYFESGLGKVLSGDPQWRHLTAMYEYYQNGPLPNWIGWYAQQLPHPFHSFVALATLVLELGLVWTLFLPRRWRIACFFVVTPFQLGIILTSNLAFLNHLVLSLGVLLLDDRFLGGLAGDCRRLLGRTSNFKSGVSTPGLSLVTRHLSLGFSPRLSLVTRHLSQGLKAVSLTWIFYNTTVLLALILIPYLPLPTAPIAALEPFRISNQYGLFAVMTTARYEIEFQGSNDGGHWTAYPFKYKPQDPRQPPRIYAPYQPRFDWNLWFASLGSWREYPWVVQVEKLLLQNDASVLSLFARDPFAGKPPREVRAVEWQYWFTDRATKNATGLWWRCDFRGLYAPELERQPDGRIVIVESPDSLMVPGSVP